jgi:hypothetical protein
MAKQQRPKRTQATDLPVSAKELSAAEASGVKGGTWWGICHGTAPQQSAPGSPSGGSGTVISATSTPQAAAGESQTAKPAQDTAMNPIRNLK